MKRSNQENFQQEDKVNKDHEIYMSGTSDTLKSMKNESMWDREMV